MILTTAPSPDVSPLAIAGLQVIGTVIGAAIGGGVTWITAAKKLKGERAFDRRLEWHERMHARLSAALNTIEDVCIKLTHTPSYSTDDAWDAMIQASQSIRDERVPAQMYAGPEVIRRLADLRTSIADELLSPEMREEPTRAKTIKSFENVRDMLIEATLAIAAEARRHLGVEPLTADQLREATQAKSKWGNDS